VNGCVVKHGKCLVEISLRIVENFDRNMVEPPYKHYGQLIEELRNESGGGNKKLAFLGRFYKQIKCQIDSFSRKEHVSYILEAVIQWVFESHFGVRVASRPPSSTRTLDSFPNSYPILHSQQ